MNNMKLMKTTAVLFFLLLTAACGSNKEESTPVPVESTTENVAATAVSPPTPTTAVAAALPTVPPPPPTIAPAATFTPPPAALPTATPLPVLLMSADDFGTEYNRLTGEKMADTAVLDRRPIACKLSNFPASQTRPQSGLNSADILYEHVTEGHLTRFTAIFYGTAPETIGPIRSARLIDLELPAMYDAALCFSGAGTGIYHELSASDFRGRILRSNSEGFYRTGDETKGYEHTLYAKPEGLWNELGRMGQNVPPTFGKGMIFDSTPQDGGTEATTIEIIYPSIDVRWVYQPENNRYWRWSDDVPHLDGITNEQVNFSNLIIPIVDTVEDVNICEQVNADNKCVAFSLEIQLWGSGPAIVYRDGQRYDVTWHRDGRYDMLNFTDANGDPFPLQVGNSMMQVVPSYLANTVSDE